MTSIATWAKEDDRHAKHRDRRPQHIPAVRAHTVDQPEPHEGRGHVDATVRRVDPPRCDGMQGKKPHKHRETDSRRYEDPQWRGLAQPQIGQVATGNLRNRRSDEKTNCHCRMHGDRCFLPGKKAGSPLMAPSRCSGSVDRPAGGSRLESRGPASVPVSWDRPAASPPAGRQASQDTRLHSPW